MDLNPIWCFCRWISGCSNSIRRLSFPIVCSPHICPKSIVCKNVDLSQRAQLCSVGHWELCFVLLCFYDRVSGFSLYCPGPDYRAQCGGLNEKCLPRKLRFLKTSSPDGYAFGKGLGPVEGRDWWRKNLTGGGRWECITSPHFQFTFLASHESWRYDLPGSCSGSLTTYLPTIKILPLEPKNQINPFFCKLPLIIVLAFPGWLDNIWN